MKQLIILLIFISLFSTLFSCDYENEKLSSKVNTKDLNIKDTVLISTEEPHFRTKITNKSGVFADFTAGDTFDLHVEFFDSFKEIMKKSELIIIEEDSNCFEVVKLSNEHFKIIINSNCQNEFISYRFKLKSSELVFARGNNKKNPPEIYSYCDNLILVTHKNLLKSN